MFGIACIEELTRGAVAGSQRPRKTGECQAFGTTTCPRSRRRLCQSSMRMEHARVSRVVEIVFIQAYMEANW